MNTDIQTLKHWLKESNYTVVFTGAGMSTESGLPDFRSSSSGIWTNQNPMRLASVEAMEKNRYRFIEFYQHRINSLLRFQPNLGHKILAKWENKRKIKAIISQNVDGYHQEAGSQNVSELHGTLRTCHCSDCQKVFSSERFLEEPFTCDCGGFIRPSVVLFGEMLPEDALIQAARETNRAELFLVLGSSLSVSPANFFPVEAKENKAKVVIINMEKTEMDDVADLVIHNQRISTVLQELDG